MALIYARKSVVKTKRDELSPERQVAMCVDAGGHRSGGSETHRPEWRRMKAQLSRPDVAAVVVSDLTRASRSLKDLYNFLDECNKHGVEFISLTQPLGTTTAHGRAMQGMSAVWAALEREIASERAITAIAFKRDNGKHVGNAPYGTKRDDQGVLVESEDWPACRIALEAYASGAYSVYRLPAYLNAQGLRFRNRQHELVPFDRWSVRSIISNVLIYAGFIIRGHGKDMSIPRDIDQAEDVVGELAQRVGAVPGKHAPFIRRELASRIIRSRRSAMKDRGVAEHRDYVLAPVLRCALCGGPLRGIRKNGRPVYEHAGHVCARRVARPDAEQIEAHVLGKLATLKLTAEARAQIRRRVEDRMRSTPDQADTAAAIAALESKLERLKALFVEGDIEREQYDQQKRAAQMAIADMRGRLGPQLLSLDAAFSELDNIAAVLQTGTSKDKRRAVAYLFERIEVDKSGAVCRMVFKTWASVVFGELPTSLVKMA